MKHTILLLLTALFLTSPAMQGQVKVQVGYTVAAYPSEVAQGLTQCYNTTRPWLDKTMGNVGSMSGLHAGIALPIGPGALGLDWSAKNRRLKASGVAPATGEEAERKLKYAYNSLDLSYRVRVNDGPIRVSPGLMGGVGWYFTRTSLDGQKTTLQNQLRPHFGAFVDFAMNGEAWGLYLRPFVQKVVGQVDLSDVYPVLDPNGLCADPPSPYLEKVFLVGVMAGMRFHLN